MEKVKYFKHLGSRLRDDARCTCKIKSTIAMAKATFNKKKNIFIRKLDLNFRKKLVKSTFFLILARNKWVPATTAWCVL
jgi:hypothetical protein